MKPAFMSLGPGRFGRRGIAEVCMSSAAAGTAMAPPRGIRWLMGSISLVLAVLPFVVGCNHFSLFKAKDKPADKVDAVLPEQEAVAAPRKYQIRIPPYVFLSDFEIP